MKAFFLKILILCVALTSVYGQEATQELSDAELAKKTQNPIANLISLPLQNNTNFGIGPFDRNQNILNVQPVIPTQISEKWNLINRLIIPIVSQPDISMPTGSEFGLADIAYQGFFTPITESAVTWGFGPVALLPTATIDALKTNKFSLGPTVVVFAAVSKWTLGFTAYNAWSVAGNSNSEDVNLGFLQYFINYNLPQAWYITSAPSLSVDWNAPSKDQWIVPFGGGVGKIFAIGKQKFNGQVSAYYNAVNIESLDGPDWTLRVQLAFLFPK